MSDYTISTTVPKGYDETVAATRAALEDQGFGVLTEIDLAAKLKEKIDVDIPPQVILGACRPPLAHEAIQADPSVAALLPCNVVVRSVGAAETVVEAFDPGAMTRVADVAALEPVAADAKERLQAAVSSLAAD